MQQYQYSILLALSTYHSKLIWSFKVAKTSCKWRPTKAFTAWSLSVAGQTSQSVRPQNENDTGSWFNTFSFKVDFVWMDRMEKKNASSMPPFLLYQSSVVIHDMLYVFYTLESRNIFGVMLLHKIRSTRCKIDSFVSQKEGMSVTILRTTSFKVKSIHVSIIVCSLYKLFAKYQNDLKDWNPWSGVPLLWVSKYRPNATKPCSEVAYQERSVLSILSLWLHYKPFSTVKLGQFHTTRFFKAIVVALAKVCLSISLCLWHGNDMIMS